MPCPGARRRVNGAAARRTVRRWIVETTERPVEDIVARTRAATSAGAREMNFYNYGLVPAARLDWVQTATDAVTS
jgi:hypothetical protein